MLAPGNCTVQGEIVVEHLVGKHFKVAEVEYVIVDVRNIDGETLVYAEPGVASRGPRRAAFRYSDIQPTNFLNTDSAQSEASA